MHWAKKDVQGTGALELSLVRRAQAERGHTEPGITGLEGLGPQEAKAQPPLPDLNFWAAFLEAVYELLPFTTT